MVERHLCKGHHLHLGKTAWDVKSEAGSVHRTAHQRAFPGSHGIKSLIPQIAQESNILLQKEVENY
jgi:hypothetical protein